MMTALLSVGAWAENLWNGSTAIGYYDNNSHVQGVEFPSTVSLQVGDLIVVTANVTGNYWNTVKVCKANNYWSGDVLLTLASNIASENGKQFFIPVTTEILTALESGSPQNRLYFDGNDYTLTSVDIVYGKDNLYTNVEGYVQNYWGGYHLTSELFTLANAGDVLTLDISYVGGDQYGENIKICNKEPNSGSDGANPEGYTEFATLKASSVTTVYLPLTNEILTAAKSEGLYIGGGNYKYTSVDLYYGTIKNVNIASMTNGTVTTTKTRATTGATVTLTVTPDGNYELGTLTVTDENSASVDVTNNGDGTYTFTMPATAVTVNATFTHNDDLTLSTGKILCFNSTGGRVTEQRYYTDTHTLWVGDGEHNGWDLTIGRTATTEEFTGVTISFSDKQNIQLEIAYNDGSDHTYTKDLSSETSPVSITFSTEGITGVLKSIMFKRVSSGDSKIVFNNETSVKMQIAGEATYPTPRSSMTLTYETLEDTGNSSVTYDRTNKTFTIAGGDDAHWAFWDFILPLPTSLYNGINFNLTQAPAGSKIEIIYDGNGDNPQQVSIESEVSSEKNFNVNFNQTGNVTRIRFAGAGTYKMGTCTAKPAKYQVTVSAAKYATFGDLGSPDVINYGSADPSGLKAYIAYVEDSKVKLEEVSKATANTAVILYADVETATSYTVNTTDESVSTTTHTNQLQISDGTVEGDGSTIYVLANKTKGVGFYLLTSGQKVLAGKAYLKVTGSGSRSFIGIGDDTTGIDEVSSKTEEVRSDYYDLQGRRVAQPTKGLYIVNGKKVIVK